MILLEYPVALILKAWHWLLSGALGVDPTMAWLYSIPLLVITVRGFLLPMTYRQFRSSRRLASVRLELRMINMVFLQRRDPKDKEAQKELRARRRQVYDRVGYKLSDGCLPIFILFPILIGLYRLLLRISRPTEGLDAAHQGYGPLTGEDVTQFLSVQFFGVPLPAYHAMSDEHLIALGTDPSTVLQVTVILIFFASAFTTANLLYSIRRNSQTMDYTEPLTHLIHKFMWWMVPAVMLFPWIFGLLGPAPLAILIYWVCNNLWTAAQNFSLQALLDRTHPYTEEFLEDVKHQKHRYQAYMLQMKPDLHRRQVITISLLATLCGASAVATVDLALSDRNNPSVTITDDHQSTLESAAPAEISLAGQCLTWDVSSDGMYENVRAVSCEEPHLFEIAADYDLTHTAPVDLGQGSAQQDSRSQHGQHQFTTELCAEPTLVYLNGRFDPMGQYSVAAMPAPDGMLPNSDHAALCGVIRTNADGHPVAATGHAAHQDQSRTFEPDTCVRVLGDVAREVSCDGPYDWIATTKVTLSERFGDDAWPATVDQNIYLDITCTAAANSYLGGDGTLEESGRKTFWTVVEEQSWKAGSRTVNCGVTS